MSPAQLSGTAKVCLGVVGADEPAVAAPAMPDPLVNPGGAALAMAVKLPMLLFGN